MKKVYGVSGVRVTIYEEGKYILPMFKCTKCKKESYYFSMSVCDDCCMANCRVCGVKITGSKNRIFYNKRVTSKPHRPFVCDTCFVPNKVYR